MKRLFVFLFPALFMFCGCTSTRYTEINGERFAMISEKEEDELADQARLIIKQVKSRLSPAEKRLVEIRKPEADLETPEDKERGVHFSVSWPCFFFSFVLVFCWLAYTFTIWLDACAKSSASNSSSQVM